MEAANTCRISQRNCLQVIGLKWLARALLVCGRFQQQFGLQTTQSTGKRGSDRPLVLLLSAVVGNAPNQDGER